MPTKPALAVVAVTATLSLIVAGGVLASNMGHKIIYELKGPGPGSGTNYIGLPFIPEPGLVTARDLFVDIMGQGSGQDSILRIDRHKKATNEFEFYTLGGGTLPPDGWNLVPGEAVIVKMLSDSDYRTVGAHDPSVVVELIAASPGISANGKNYVAPPINSSAVTARDLFMEIGGSVLQLDQHQKDNDAFEVYTYGGGTLPPDGWNITRGEGYIVTVLSSMSWVPEHY